MLNLNKPLVFTNKIFCDEYVFILLKKLIKSFRLFIYIKQLVFFKSTLFQTL